MTTLTFVKWFLINDDDDDDDDDEYETYTIFNPIFHYDFKFFCSFVSYLTTCQLTICQLID